MPRPTSLISRLRQGSRIVPRRRTTLPPSTAKLQRWVDLVAALLHHHAPVTLDALCDEVPGYDRLRRSKPSLRRTFERDKDEFRALGLPIETVTLDDTSGYRLRAGEFYLPYLATVVDGRTRAPQKVDRDGYRALTTLTFEADEVLALRRALARLREVGVRELLADAERALHKMALDLPELAPPDPTASQGNGGTEFDILMDALAARRRVRFDYYSIGGDRRSERVVRPWGLFFLHGHWYLAAVDDDAPEGPVKNFRVSRITGARLVGTSRARPDYVIPRTFSLSDHAKDRRPWELGDHAALSAEVRFAPADGATAAAARLGAPVPGKPDVRRFEVRRVDSFARWLLSFAGSATPLAPAEVVDAYAAERRAVAALYRGSADA